jgi:hypothetical protein
VDGYTAVFRRDEAVKTISKDEYPKFSHQVPCFHLTNEKGGKLRGCLELDPNSLPDVFFGCSHCINEGKACQANIVLSQDDYPTPTVCRLINLLYSSYFL